MGHKGQPGDGGPALAGLLDFPVQVVIEPVVDPDVQVVGKLRIVVVHKPWYIRGLISHNMTQSPDKMGSGLNLFSNSKTAGNLTDLRGFVRL